MTKSEMDVLIEEHFGYEQRDDVDGVVATLSDDAVHDIVGWPHGPSEGRENARNFYDVLFNDLADSSFKTVSRLYGDNFVVDESYFKAKAVGRPFGLEGRGRKIEFRLLHIFEFKDGKIARENVWFDFAALQQQLGN